MRYFSILLLFLAGCTTTGDYQKSAQKWVGASQQQLFEAWGMPNNQFPAGQDTEIVTYVQNDNGPIGGNTQPYAGVEVAYPAIENPQYGENLSNYPDNTQVYFCKTTFTITNGTVVDYSFNGDDCVTKESAF